MRRDGEFYLFDFSGIAPLPEDDLERRAAVLLEQLEDMRRLHPGVFARLGIDVQIVFRDEHDP